jgi:HEAT repeat protein
VDYFGDSCFSFALLQLTPEREHIREDERNAIMKPPAAPARISRYTRLAVLTFLGSLLCACSTVGKLKSSNPDVRRAAAEELGRKHAVTAVDPLISALADPDAGVRRAAAKALGEIGDKRAAVPILSRFPSEDPYTQQDFADALGDLKDPQAVPVLLTAFKTQDEFGRKHMSDALGYIGTSAIPGVIALLRDPDARVREAAAHCVVSIAYNINVGNTKGDMRALDPALPVVTGLLTDPDSRVRGEAANALSRIQSPSSMAPLIALLHDPDDDVRESDANALSSYGEAAVEPLLSALRDPDPNVRIGAARALGYMAWVGNSTRSADALAEGAAQGNLEIAAGAFTYLISRGDSAFEPLLIEAFEKYPANRMGNEMLNSGNKTLADAVQSWADKHGMKIEEKSSPAGTAKWGKH